MIPNVVKGGNMYGLIRYLQGPGRENEHTTPHVVAGDDFLTAWYGTEILEGSSVKEISDYLDAPREYFGTTVRAQMTEQDQETGDKVVVGYRDAHVWHCSLSLGPEDGALGNERWQALAGDFMDRMGFTEASGKSPCRWVAIHHGTSANGNDHIHIAASMVREDGTRWDGRWRDYRAAQEAARELEVKHGLAAVDGPALGIAERGEKPAEQRRAAAASRGTTEPKELGQVVRAAAVASSSEAEWIRRARAEGVVLKPYFAKGSTDVVRGYKAALKPTRSETGGKAPRDKLVFYGGGQLGQDLTLPRLREMWGEPSIEASTAAAGEWQAAFRGQAPVGVDGVETRRLAERAPDVAATNLAGFNARLATLPAHDRQAWGDAARDVSGALSAWARFDPGNAAELRSAAAVVARSAQLKRPSLPAGRRVKESPMGTAFIFLAAKPDQKSKIAAGLLLRQIMTTVRALRDHQAAAGELRQARAIEAGALARLERVQLVGYHRTHDDQVLVDQVGGAVATRERPETAAQEPPAGTQASEGASRVRRVREAFETGQEGDAGTGAEPLPRPLPPRREQTQEPGQKSGQESGERTASGAPSPGPSPGPERPPSRGPSRGGEQHER